jgi:hypothetical protein
MILVKSKLAYTMHNDFTQIIQIILPIMKSHC